MKTNACKEEFEEQEREGEYPVPNLFFRVSKVVPSAQMLETWVSWFKQRNIPCVITKASGGYSLWRGGEEIDGGPSVAVSALEKKGIVYSFGLCPGEESGRIG
ncbi:MAG TPA: hypothetical protein VGJ94_18315 [Syntrophorhabdaceae bacterium]|jgi:hypothetical protein